MFTYVIFGWWVFGFISKFFVLFEIFHHYNKKVKQVSVIQVFLSMETPVIIVYENRDT